VERDELLAAVWRERAVDPNNLGQGISALRRVLQEGEPAETYIITMPGHGYRFGAPVTFEPFAVALPDPPILPKQLVPLPPPAAVPVRPRRWVAALAILTVCALALWWSESGRRNADHSAGPQAFSPPPHSVAVLAFSNLTGDRADDYISDGLSEDLTDALGRVGALRVAGMLSSFSFKGRSLTAGEIGRRLNVGAVLQGSVRREGSRLRVSVHLVDAASGFQLWSASYDRERGTVLDAQRDIAHAVAAAVRGPLLGAAGNDDSAPLALGGTADPAAFDAYLRGIKLVRDSDSGAYRRAVAAFDEAVGRDPGFALAHVHRALALQTLADAEDSTDIATVAGLKQTALAEAGRAVALTPDLAAAHAALGFTLEQTTFDFARARNEYAQALALAPNDPDTNRLYADAEIRFGHQQAGLAAAARAAARDPLASYSYVQLAGALLDLRRYDAAWDALHHAEQLQSARSIDIEHLQADLQLAQHDFAGARRSCAAAHDWQAHLCLAVALHALGDTPGAEAQLAALRATNGDTAALQYAEIYAQWGRTNDALEWLRKAYRLRDPGLIALRVDPMLDPIRTTGTYVEIEHALHFPK
jgi:TolB-like protein